jgi:hypothetical protein
MIELEDAVGFEYLDDGGLLVANLAAVQGDYWQLSPPAGGLWAIIWESRDFSALAAAFTASTGDAADGVAAAAELCSVLEARGVVRRWSVRPP